MFDYFEGNLSKHEQIEFERFLEVNPQYEEDLHFWEDSFEHSTDVPVYETPQALYRSSVFSRSNKVYALLLILALVSTIGIYNYDDFFNNKVLVENNKIIKEGLLISKLEKPVTNGKQNLSIKTNEIRLKEEGVGTKVKSPENKKENKNSLISILIKEIKKDNLEDPLSSHKIRAKEKDLQGHSSVFFNLSNERIKKNDFTLENKIRKKLKKEMVEITVPVANKTVEKYTEQKTNTSKYNYLDFKREHDRLGSKKTKRKTRRNRKPESSKHDYSFKARDKEFSENFALIASLFYIEKGKAKKSKHIKFFDKFKNKELALTNTHDPIFIITNSNPTDNNLALVGGLDMTRIKANFSNRWRNSLNEINSGVISGDTYFKKLNAGLGITAKTIDLSENNFNTSSLGVTYSQRIELKDESSINIGVNYSYLMNRFSNSFNENLNDIEFKQNIVNSSETMSSNSFTSSAHNFSSALWYDGQFLYGGINLENIKTIKNENNNANEFVEYINPFKFAMQLGTDYRRNVYSALVISPQVNFRYQQGNSELWVGSVLKYKRFVTGLGASFSNAYKLSIGVQGDNLRLIYGFDYSKSKVEGRFYGTHEVSLRYLLRGNNNWKK
jgi:type IX secretion system PorP/SprF family membrane protein